MPRVSKRVATLAVLAIAAGGLAACSSSTSSNGSSTAPTSATSSEKPQSGGTLNIVAASGPDHIDTVSAPTTPPTTCSSAGTPGSCVSYPTVPDRDAPRRRLDDGHHAGRRTPRPQVPTVANGGITGGGTITPSTSSRASTGTPRRPPGHLRRTSCASSRRSATRSARSATRSTSPARSPGLAGVLQRGDRLLRERKAHAPTAANIANFQNTHSIAGITTPNSSTIVFHADGAGQRLHLHDGDAVHLGPPGRVRQLRAGQRCSWTQHTISDGPYQISSYVAGQVDHVGPATRPGSSPPTPLRHEYVTKIV